MRDLISLLFDLLNLDVLELSMLLLERTRLDALARVTDSHFFGSFSASSCLFEDNSLTTSVLVVSVLTGSWLVLKLQVA